MDEINEIPKLPTDELQSITIDYNDNKKSSVKWSGILFMQFTICIIILISAFVCNIVRKGTVNELSENLKAYSGSDTQELYTRTADTVISYIYD